MPRSGTTRPSSCTASWLHESVATAPEHAWTIGFKVKNGDQVVANYTGVVPDTFKDGAEVVLKGRLSEAGFQVEPNGVTAQVSVEVCSRDGEDA